MPFVSDELLAICATPFGHLGHTLLAIWATHCWPFGPHTVGHLGHTLLAIWAALFGHLGRAVWPFEPHRLVIWPPDLESPGRDPVYPPVPQEVQRNYPNQEPQPSSQGYQPKSSLASGGYQPNQPYPPGGYQPNQPYPPGGYQPNQPYPPGGYQPNQPYPPGGYQPNQPYSRGGYQPNQPYPHGGYQPNQPYASGGHHPNIPGGYPPGAQQPNRPGGYPNQPSYPGSLPNPHGGYQPRPGGIVPNSTDDAPNTEFLGGLIGGGGGPGGFFGGGGGKGSGYQPPSFFSRKVAAIAVNTFIGDKLSSGVVGDVMRATATDVCADYLDNWMSQAHTTRDDGTVEEHLSKMAVDSSRRRILPGAGSLISSLLNRGAYHLRNRIMKGGRSGTGDVINPAKAVWNGILTEEWLAIPLETIHKLYESIPRRIEAVIAAKGGPTPY
ncbi:hypothetical protein FHG87_009435 [Trinorchestia longiramus]|nr:hypothetical protein FHG87_009435 [Trinorchestia longiramus]